MVTVLVNTICNEILVTCVSVRGINVLIKLKKKKSVNLEGKSLDWALIPLL